MRSPARAVAPAAPGPAGAGDRRNRTAGPGGQTGLQLPPPLQGLDAGALGPAEAMLCSPTGSIGGLASFLGSPLPQHLPLFQPSPRRAPAGAATATVGGSPAARGLAPPSPSVSGLSNLFASPMRGAPLSRRPSGGGFDAAGAGGLGAAADLLATPCSRRAGSGRLGDLGGPADDLDTLMLSPPLRRGTNTASGGESNGGGRGSGRPRRAASLDALLDFVGAPPGVAAAAAAAAAGPLSPTGGAFGSGELDLLTLLQGPQTTAAAPSGPAAPPVKREQLGPGRHQQRPLRRCLDLGASSGAPGQERAAAADAGVEALPAPLSTAAMAAAFAASLGGGALPDQVLEPASPHCHETLLPSPPSLRVGAAARAAAAAAMGGDDGGSGSGEDSAVKTALQVAPLFTSPTAAFEITRASARRSVGSKSLPAPGEASAAPPFAELTRGAVTSPGGGGGGAAAVRSPQRAGAVSAATLQRLVANGLDLAFPAASATASGGTAGEVRFVAQSEAPSATPASREAALQCLSAGLPFFDAPTPATPMPAVPLMAPEPRACTCKKTRCLKMYCDCFAAGAFCGGCACRDCLNTEATADEVLTARARVMQRDARAFEPKLQTGTSSGPTHRRGCACKKSRCLRKYCECFQHGIACGPSCKCESCQNGNNPQAEALRIAHAGSKRRGARGEPAVSHGTPPTSLLQEPLSAARAAAAAPPPRQSARRLAAASAMAAAAAAVGSGSPAPSESAVTAIAPFPQAPVASPASVTHAAASAKANARAPVPPLALPAPAADAWCGLGFGLPPGLLSPSGPGGAQHAQHGASSAAADEDEEEDCLLVRNTMRVGAAACGAAPYNPGVARNLMAGEAPEPSERLQGDEEVMVKTEPGAAAEQPAGAAEQALPGKAASSGVAPPPRAMGPPPPVARGAAAAAAGVGTAAAAAAAAGRLVRLGPGGPCVLVPAALLEGPGAGAAAGPGEAAGVVLQLSDEAGNRAAYYVPTGLRLAEGDIVQATPFPTAAVVAQGSAAPAAPTAAAVTPRPAAAAAAAVGLVKPEAPSAAVAVAGLEAEAPAAGSSPAKRHTPGKRKAGDSGERENRHQPLASSPIKFSLAGADSGAADAASSAQAPAPFGARSRLANAPEAGAAPPQQQPQQPQQPPQPQAAAAPARSGGLLRFGPGARMRLGPLGPTGPR